MSTNSGSTIAKSRTLLKNSLLKDEDDDGLSHSLEILEREHIKNSAHSSRVLKGTIVKDELQDGLLSLEKLDRSSPDLWPEKIPGITDFIAMSDTPIRTPAPEWARGLSTEDIAEMKQLSTLPANGLVMEIKKIYDEAYQLGVNEAKEMTRGKYLGIFNNAKKKAI